jgi:hypothetical protein
VIAIDPSRNLPRARGPRRPEAGREVRDVGEELQRRDDPETPDVEIPAIEQSRVVLRQVVAPAPAGMAAW